MTKGHKLYASLFGTQTPHQKAKQKIFQENLKTKIPGKMEMIIIPT